MKNNFGRNRTLSFQTEIYSKTSSNHSETFRLDTKQRKRPIIAPQPKRNEKNKCIANAYLRLAKLCC